MSENEKEKENNQSQKDENINIEIQRNGEKKATLNLSEIPNIINEVTQYYGNSKNGVSPIFDDNSLMKINFNQTNLKTSFINEPISHNKEESRSSLEEIQSLIRNIINEHKNKSIGKK